MVLGMVLVFLFIEVPLGQAAQLVVWIDLDWDLKPRCLRSNGKAPNIPKSPGCKPTFFVKATLGVQMGLPFPEGSYFWDSFEGKPK